MPPQPQKSALMAKYGAKLAQAAANHADDPIDYGFTRLPGGIDNGIARLTKCYFDVFKADSQMKQADGSSAVGQYYLRCEGSVEEPDEGPDGEPCKGLLTSVMIPLCERGIKWGKGILDFDACVKRAQNELKKLGGADMDFRDLEAAAEALTAVAPRFRFRTRTVPAKLENQEDRVFEDWLGIEGVDQDVAADATAATEDETAGDGAEVVAEEGTEVSADDNPDGAAVDVDNETDLATLVGLAGTDVEVPTDSTEYAARSRLTTLATEAGVDQNAIDEAADWQALADLIEAAQNPPPEPTPAPAPKKQVVKPTPAAAKPAPAKAAPKAAPAKAAPKVAPKRK